MCDEYDRILALARHAVGKVRERGRRYSWWCSVLYWSLRITSRFPYEPSPAPCIRAR
jgi:hypothetical protein